MGGDKKRHQGGTKTAQRETTNAALTRGARDKKQKHIPTRMPVCGRGAFIGCILKNSYNFVIELSHRGME